LACTQLEVCGLLKDGNDLNFDFNAVQILWTLTFAALLVLLVVLLGRDRMGRYPWFTASIVVVALNLLGSRLLYGKLPRLTLDEIFITLADVSGLVSLLVLIEIARRAFKRAGWLAWAVWTIVLLAIGGVVLAKWGPWPTWSTITPNTLIARLSLMQMAAEKLGILTNVLALALCLVVITFGRRYGAGWRSHTQQIIIGIATASAAQMAVQVIWQMIVKVAAPHSMAEYQRIVDIKPKLINANSTVYIAVIVWWIACLWIDELGNKPVAAEAAPADASLIEADPERESETPADATGPAEGAPDEVSQQHGEELS
jgi:hypothetical protein